MFPKLFILSTVLLLLIGLTGLRAQESINAAGGDVSGMGGSVSYSVGQLVYTSGNGANGSIAQGVQHPYEIWVVFAKDEDLVKNINLSVYPNPTAGYLTLRIEESGISGFSYQLYDNHGKIFQTEKITANHSSIDMSSLAPAVYFVTIFQQNKEIKTFKIIKY